jgi:hypothetical protein
MRAPREYRRWVDRLKQRHAKSSGTVPAFAFDSPHMERKRANSARRRKRVKRVDLCKELGM